jgi:hypothetical protein
MMLKIRFLKIKALMVLKRTSRAFIFTLGRLIAPPQKYAGYIVFPGIAIQFSPLLESSSIILTCKAVQGRGTIQRGFSTLTEEG